MEKGFIYFKDTKRVENGLLFIENLEDRLFFNWFKKKAINNEILCNKCKQPIIATFRKDTKTKYIRHRGKKGKNNKCDNFQYTKNTPKYIKSAIYHGEGSLHEELKNEIVLYLKNDKNFKNIKEEMFLYHETEHYESGARKRRKPDISCNFKNQRLAIEVQLSYQL